MALTFDDLPDNTEEAFSAYEARVKDSCEEQMTGDRQYHTDRDGNCEGLYVTAIVAFLDEDSIDSNMEDISELDDDEFLKELGRFKSKVEYVSIRFNLRPHRIKAGVIGTIISIESRYKAATGARLEKIRKIVNQEADEGSKRDKIFTKIPDLQSEIDRDMTTIDAAFGRWLDLGRAIGDFAESVRFAIDQFERIANLFLKHMNRGDVSPQPERPKMPPRTAKEALSSGLGDDIPFWRVPQTA
ncbi:MAG: hypothetical protein OXC91_07805 [Rhodobacteraceae bacterium]|nr:hypothetical protein [Paracoccaceae bacterium]